LSTLEPKGLRGGTAYYDGQFDDARLAIALARTAVDLGATVLNYFQVTALLKPASSSTFASKGDAPKIRGVMARDLETNRQYELRARVVVNATGVFSDAIRRLDDPQAPRTLAPSQGAHIVLHRSYLPGDSAIMV